MLLVRPDGAHNFVRGTKLWRSSDAPPRGQSEAIILDACHGREQSRSALTWRFLLSPGEAPENIGNE
jgi:hypothetical protein